MSRGRIKSVGGEGRGQSRHRASPTSCSLSDWSCSVEIHPDNCQNGIIRTQESATFAANYVITQDGSPRFLQLNIPGIFELIAWRNNSSHLGGGAEGIQIKIVWTGKTKYIPKLRLRKPENWQGRFSILLLTSLNAGSAPILLPQPQANSQELNLIAQSRKVILI